MGSSGSHAVTRLAATGSASASMPKMLDAARVGRQQARDHAQRGRLAGAVGAQQRVQLARAHRQIEIVDRDGRKRLAQAANAQRVNMRTRQAAARHLTKRHTTRHGRCLAPVPRSEPREYLHGLSSTLTDPFARFLLPLPACGERVGVRCGDILQRRSKRPPLTLALSPLKCGERGFGRRYHQRTWSTSLPRKWRAWLTLWAAAASESG